MAYPVESLEITPAETAALLGGALTDSTPVLLDCRTAEEHRLARIDGDTLIPMDELPWRLPDLEVYGKRPIIVYCHMGVRSLAAASFLRQHGFASARSLAGGIDRWSREIDPSVPRY